MIASRFGAMLLVAAVVAGACSGDDDSSGTTVPADDATTSTTSSSTTSSTTSTTEDPTAAVEQAFYDQWDAFVEILSAPDPANPLIDKHFAGDARATVLDIIASDLTQNFTTSKPEDPMHFVPRIESVEFVSPITALVTECTVDGLVIRNRDTGEVVNDVVATVRIKNRFELDDGRWRVASSTRIARSEGVVDCAELS